MLQDAFCQYIAPGDVGVYVRPQGIVRVVCEVVETRARVKVRALDSDRDSPLGIAPGDEFWVEPGSLILVGCFKTFKPVRDADA